MKTSLAALTAAVVLSAPFLAAEERMTTPSHLVSLEAAQVRLVETASQRARNLATMDAFVSSPDGAAAFSAAGLSGERVRASLATLSDAELQDLASRAAALETDPTAGAFTNRQLLIGAVVLAVVILIILIA
jgi:hypothetical protein